MTCLLPWENQKNCKAKEQWLYKANKKQIFAQFCSAMKLLTLVHKNCRHFEKVSFRECTLSFLAPWSNCSVSVSAFAVHVKRFSMWFLFKKWGSCIIWHIIVPTERNSGKNDKKWNIAYLKVTKNNTAKLLPLKQNKGRQSSLILLCSTL